MSTRQLYRGIYTSRNVWQHCYDHEIRTFNKCINTYDKSIHKYINIYDTSKMYRYRCWIRHASTNVQQWHPDRQAVADGKDSTGRSLQTCYELVNICTLCWKPRVKQLTNYTAGWLWLSSTSTRSWMVSCILTYYFAGTLADYKCYSKHKKTVYWDKTIIMYKMNHV